jgi:hypothetical protein
MRCDSIARDLSVTGPGAHDGRSGNPEIRYDYTTPFCAK